MLNDKATTDIAKKMSWPKGCAWPAPIGEYGGINWDEDMIPCELDDETEELVEIKDYFDQLVEDGRLNEKYYLIEDESDEETWYPEQGEDFWFEDHFDIDYWIEEVSNHLNCIKLDVGDVDPTLTIYSILDYRFINENLLRQAFTRRAFQIEYGLSGCSEELEFLGDSILSLVTTKELMKHFSEVQYEDTAAPFQVKFNEGELSRLKSTFVCKEHLAKRCEALGLDKYILYGTGEAATESAKEDVIEALIGAVAMDCNWDMAIMEDVIDRLVSMQIDEPEQYLKKSYYELLNSWHMRHFGFEPEYEIYKNSRRNPKDDSFYCLIKFCVPENDNGVETGQAITENGTTRSKARDAAAESAYRFLVNKGLWMNLKDASVVPAYETAVNQLQELFQKKYIEQPEYDFSQEAGRWVCNCVVNGITSMGKGSGKVAAKKMAAYECLVRLLKSAGCCKDEWYSQMMEMWTDNIVYKKVEVTVEKIEAKATGGIKYDAVAAVLEQIEPGKVITERVLTEWISKKYGIANLAINWKEFPYPVLRDDSIPFHRFLSSKGLVQEYYKDQLLAEGHEIVPTKTDNWRVLDYKETMVDVSTLSVPEDAVGPEGSFQDHVKRTTE